MPDYNTLTWKHLIKQDSDGVNLVSLGFDNEKKSLLVSAGQGLLTDDWAHGSVSNGTTKGGTILPDCINSAAGVCSSMLP